MMFIIQQDRNSEHICTFLCDSEDVKSLNMSYMFIFVNKTIKLKPLPKQ